MILLNLVVWILIAGLVFGIIWWGIDQITLIPEPFKQVAKGVTIIAIIIILISVLVTGHTGFPNLIGGATTP